MSIKPLRSEPLSARELYLFDTTGLLRIPGFLSPADVAASREEILRIAGRMMQGRGDKQRFDDLARHSHLLGDLARNRAMRNFVEPLINQPYRLVESYGLRRELDSVFYLHNGNSEILRYGDSVARRNMSFRHEFHDGQLYCMLVKVIVYLTDLHQEEDGPFCYLQGSHKANWPWFPSTESADARPTLTKENFPSLEQMHTDAGDALILNEALLHGTLPKTTEGERIVMAFTYAPAFVAAWKAVDVDSDDIDKIGHY